MPEACDDDNAVAGDGCTSCTVDPGYTCYFNRPSFCYDTAFVPVFTGNGDALVAALGTAAPGEVFVLKAGSYKPSGGASITIDQDVVMVPETAGAVTRLQGSADGGAILVVGLGTNVLFAGITFKAEADSDQAVDVDAATATFIGCEFQGRGSQGQGLRAHNDARVTVRESLVHSSAAGGIELDTPYFTLVNDMLYGNGTGGGGGSEFGGIWVNATPDAASVIAHVSISGCSGKDGQSGGIRCDGDMDITSSIVVYSAPMAASPACSFTESLIDGAPELASATNLHLLGSSPAIDQALSSVELIDFDGQARIGPRDIGADEL
ncbi:MAG: hypothetical protein A2138_26390 [Deltaproteobacteria bacterium RBG_16_71_12]|nr:MAG: hypothetical protein A2138_26390 [Deltaproteobacteria bacterium RBG_16_71_12]